MQCITWVFARNLQLLKMLYRSHLIVPHKYCRYYVKSCKEYGQRALCFHKTTIHQSRTLLYKSVIMHVCSVNLQLTLSVKLRTFHLVQLLILGLCHQKDSISIFAPTLVYRCVPSCELIALRIFSNKCWKNPKKKKINLCSKNIHTFNIPNITTFRGHHAQRVITCFGMIQSLRQTNYRQSRTVCAIVTCAVRVQSQYQHRFITLTLSQHVPDYFLNEKCLFSSFEILLSATSICQMQSIKSIRVTHTHR